MKTNVKDNSIIYINIALAVSVVFVLIFVMKSFFVVSNKNIPEGPVQNNTPMVSRGGSESVYDIDKVKKNVSAAGSNIKYSDFEDMYKNCDRTDVGGNMVQAWSRVKPEDKAKLSDGFDKQIVAAEETLKTEPANKHAKNLLYISKQLKKMSVEGFNYKLKNKKI